MSGHTHLYPQGLLSNTWRSQLLVRLVSRRADKGSKRSKTAASPGIAPYTPRQMPQNKKKQSKKKGTNLNITVCVIQGLSVLDVWVVRLSAQSAAPMKPIRGD
eukprot:5383555-Amphidinium_carterae.1